MWSLCRTKEIKLKAKEDVGSKERAFATMAKRKGKFGKFGPRRTNNKDMSKIQRFKCQENGHYKRNFPKLKKENNNKIKREEAHLTQEMKQEGKKQKKEDHPDLYYD